MPKRKAGVVEVVSFDVGRKNMAVCHLRGTDRGDAEILHWELLDVSAKTVREVVLRLVDELHKREWVMRAQHLVVEQQTQGNTPMRILGHAIQSCVETWRRAAGEGDWKPVCFVPARSKYDLVGGAVKGRYAVNKRASAAFVDGFVPAGAFRDAYLASPKRDDLSDACMQGLWYMERLGK